MFLWRPMGGRGGVDNTYNNATKNELHTFDEVLPIMK